MGKNSDGLPFGCFGVAIRGADDVTVEDSQIYHNGYGVFDIGGSGILVHNNNIHDNNVLIRNTVTPNNDDFGAIGIGFTNVQSGGASATDNTITNNHGPSHDYGHDGGALEIYNASQITMSSNVMSGNDDVLETGSGPGGKCDHNVLSNNTAVEAPRRLHIPGPEVFGYAARRTCSFRETRLHGQTDSESS